MELRRMLVHSIWIGTIRPHIHPFCSPCWLRICPPLGKWWETDMGAWLWWICPCPPTGKDWMRQEMRKYPRDGLGRVTEHPLSGFRGEAGCLFFPFFFCPETSMCWEAARLENEDANSASRGSGILALGVCETIRESFTVSGPQFPCL